MSAAGTTAADAAGPGPLTAEQIERTVDRFVDVTRRFDDLEFCNADGVLRLRQAVPAVTAIRIDLPGPASLQLASVVVEGAGLDDPVGQALLSTSKPANATAAKVIRSKRLLDPARAATASGDLGVCTRNQDAPWLMIEYSAPIDLQAITIHNRSGQEAERARGLQVSVRTVDGWWSTVYDARLRERQLAHAVERHFAGRLITRRATELIRRRTGRPTEQRVNPQLGDLVRLLTAIHLRTEHRSVFRQLDRIGLDRDQVAQLRRLVTDKVVAQRQQEWNIHGIQRSFRFWSEQEQRTYIRFALEVVDALRELNEDVCFGFGSVLSVVRDQQLIPHDDDLDVIIAFEPEQAANLAQGRELIRRCLVDKGFVVEGDFSSYHWVYPPGGDGPKLDAFAGIWEGDDIAWYPGKRGSLTREMMFPVVRRPLLGFDCPVPRQPEAYLEQVYGPRWQTPDPHFRHTWRRSEYADILK